MDSVVFSKMFLGIESEGPWIGLPFIQLSIGGCGHDCGDMCLDPEQALGTPAFVVQSTEIDVVVQRVATTLKRFSMWSDIRCEPNHITFDMGCAEYGMKSKELVWWNRFFEAFAAYASDNHNMAVLVENTSGRNYAPRTGDLSLHYHLRYDSFLDLPDHEWLVNTFYKLILNHDRLKLVVHSLADYMKFTNDWVEFLVAPEDGFLHGKQYWFTLVLSPHLSKEDVEMIMSDFELGSWEGCARLIMPQHFFLDRWDR